MKTQITAGLLAAAVLLYLGGAPLMAHGPQGGQQGPGNEFFAQMAQMRDIMHRGTVASQPVADGVRVTLTATEPALVEAIKTEFGGGHEIAPPHPGTTVAVGEIENGVILTFASPEPATVEWLQGRGNDLAYGILRDNMHALMNSEEFAPGSGRGGMHGWGMMGGGSMHGGGMMGGGMHGEGMMGSGMHGGGAPGWMHGWGSPGGEDPGYNVE